MTSNFHKSFDKRRYVSYHIHIFLPSEILYSGTVFAHAFSLKYDTRHLYNCGVQIIIVYGREGVKTLDQSKKYILHK